MVANHNGGFKYLSLIIILALSACGNSGSEINFTEQEKTGQRIFSQNCASCHAKSDDLVIVGPSLAGIKTRAENRVAGQDALTYIKESILVPGAFVNEGYTDLMPPTFGDILTDEEVDALIAYLYRLE